MGWIIAGSILAVILILLLCRVTIIADYGGELYLKVSYLFITLFRIPAKKLSAKKQAQKDAKAAEKTAQKEQEKEERKAEKQAEKEARKNESKAEKLRRKKLNLTFEEILDLVKMALDGIGKPLRRLLKRVTFSHLSLDAVCGGEDAAKAAINYGAANILLSTVLNLIDAFFTLKAPDDLHIGVDFYQEKTTVSVYCEVRLSLLAALACAFSLLGRVIGYYIRHREVHRPIKKLTSKNKRKKKSEENTAAGVSG